MKLVTSNLIRRLATANRSRVSIRINYFWPGQERGRPVSKFSSHLV